MAARLARRRIAGPIAWTPLLRSFGHLALGPVSGRHWPAGAPGGPGPAQPLPWLAGAGCFALVRPPSSCLLPGTCPRGSRPHPTTARSASPGGTRCRLHRWPSGRHRRGIIVAASQKHVHAPRSECPPFADLAVPPEPVAALPAYIVLPSYLSCLSGSRRIRHPRASLSQATAFPNCGATIYTSLPPRRRAGRYVDSPCEARQRGQCFCDAGSTKRHHISLGAVLLREDAISGRRTRLPLTKANDVKARASRAGVLTSWP